MDEVLIVASKAQEFTNVCWVFGYWPICDPTKFLGVHLYFSITDYDAEVVNFLFLEVALLGFQIEIVLF